MSFTTENITANDAKILCPLSKWSGRNAVGIRQCGFCFTDSLAMFIISLSMRADVRYGVGEDYATKIKNYNQAIDKTNKCNADSNSLIQPPSTDELTGHDCCDNYYVHVQSTPATLWVVEHNLGKRPDTTIVNDNEDEIQGSVTYVSDDVIHINFLTALTGKVYCN